MLPNYELVEVPFSLNFEEMPRAELKAFYQWFLASIPDRLKILEKAIRETGGYRSWRADGSVESLKKLGQWFSKVVTSREMTAEEVEAIRKSCTKIPFEDLRLGVELTDETYSLAFDVGIYFAHVFLTNDPSLGWQQELKAKRSVDYGQPVIRRSSNVVLNPLRIAQVLAHHFVEKTRGPEEIVRLYHRWCELFAQYSAK